MLAYVRLLRSTQLTQIARFGLQSLSFWYGAQNLVTATFGQPSMEGLMSDSRDFSGTIFSSSVL